MKIAVISDIHGNMDALTKVMDDIRKRGCDKIFVLGDYAMAGPEPSEVIEFFMRKQAHPDLRMIQGNTDFMISNFSNEIYESVREKAPVMAAALKNDAETINPMARNFLKELPLQIEEEIEGVKFLLVHGSPRRNNEDILPTTPLEEVEKMLENVDADTVLCGHTHIPCGFQTRNKKTVINVGSVGRPFTPEPKACYLVVNVENGKCVFEHKFIDYDNEIASEKLAKRNFWRAEQLAKTLIDPRERHF